MSSSIGSVSYSGMQRPDPSQMASKLFSKLDTKNQGYIEKSDLQSALSSIGGSSADSSTVDDVFSQLDSDSNGQVTKDEFSSAMKKVSDTLDSQFHAMRMNGFGGQAGQSGQTGQDGMAAMGGMPPPPPGGQGGQGGPGGAGGGNDAGFTKDQLTSQLSEITSSGSSDSQRADLISKVVSNFDKADSDQDGKVSFKEAMAYDQSTKTGASSGTGSSSSSSSSSAGSDSSSSDTASSGNTSSDALLMKTIMDLAKAYGSFGQGQQSQASFGSLLSSLA